MAAMDEIVSVFRNSSKTDTVNKLVQDYSVDGLSSLKVELSLKCSGIKDFPVGELFSRRRPKGASVYSSLEERLASDIFELMNCLDTEIITPEIRSMFRTATISQTEDIQPVSSNLTSDGRLSFSSPLVRESGWSGLKVQVTSMHSDFLLFREKVLSDMSNLESKVKSLSLTIESQDREIALLKEENKKLDKLYQKQDLIQDTECLQNSECLPKMTNREEPSSSVTSVNGASTNNAWRPNRLENGSSSIVAEFQDAVDNVHEEMAVNNAKITTNNDVISSPLITTIVDGEMNDGSVVDLELPGAISYVLPVVPAKALQQGQQLKPCASYAAAVQSNQQRCQEKTKQQQMEQTTGSNRDITKPSGNTVEFVGVERNRMKTKAFFLSGINDKVTPKQIHDYLCHRNIIPTLLNVFPSKRKGTISAKLNIKIKDLAGLSEPNFWPQFVRCRPWVSREKFSKTEGHRIQATQAGKHSTYV